MFNFKLLTADPLLRSGQAADFKKGNRKMRGYHIPTPALPGSGSKGMISARFFKAPRGLVQS